LFFHPHWKPRFVASGRGVPGLRLFIAGRASWPLATFRLSNTPQFSFTLVVLIYIEKYFFAIPGQIKGVVLNSLALTLPISTNDVPRPHGALLEGCLRLHESSVRRSPHVFRARSPIDWMWLIAICKLTYFGRSVPS